MKPSPRPVSPLAPSSSVDVEQTIAVTEIIAAWRKRLRIDVSAEFGSTEKLWLCRCRQSQLKFFWPVITGSAKLYETLQIAPWYYRPSKWEHERACGAVHAGARVLDLGCGSGDFVDLAVRRGLVAEGLDFNQAAVAIGRKKGLNVRCDDWESLALKIPGAFDMVTAFQVLEHLADPLRLLRSAVSLAKVEGRLVLAVPDGAGWLERSGNILDLPPHHVSRWNPAVMQFLTRILPIELEEITVEPLETVHVRDFVAASLCPTSSPGRIAEKAGIADRLLCRLVAPAVSRELVRNRLPGISMLAVFRKVMREPTVC